MKLYNQLKLRFDTPIWGLHPELALFDILLNKNPQFVTLVSDDETATRLLKRNKKNKKDDNDRLDVLVKIIILIFDPQAIIFGGSISQSFELFRESMYGNLNDFPYPRSVAKIQILTSDLLHMGILGAGALCVDANSDSRADA